MVILRDDKRIARLARIGKITSFAGMGALVAGLFLVFLPSTANLFFYQLLALFTGWTLSQVGIYLSRQYLGENRADMILDEVLQKVARNGRIYHYLLPAQHVLLIPTGIVVFVAKQHTGNISVEGDKWRQTGLGLRRWFGQERIGNPTREAAMSVEAIASYLNKNAPSVEEVPIGAMIVFTNKSNRALDVKNSSIPAMHFTKVKGYLRQQKREKPMPEEDFRAIQTAFDKKAAHLLEEAERVSVFAADDEA